MEAEIVVRAGRVRGLLRKGCARQLVAGVWLACALGSLAGAQDVTAPTAATALYVRVDTDDTTVVTPRVRVGATLPQETRVDLVYTVDVWSSASIDIRTSASKRVVEQRDEIDVSIEQPFGDLVLGGSYRYSTEYDYVSNGGSLGAALDLADKSTNVALTLRAYFDSVGRAGDPAFQRDASALSARLSFTQVIDPQMFAQLVYEPSRQQGYLSSPYRYVRLADQQGIVPSTCVEPIRLCLLERNPDTRLRHAIALSARRALSEPLAIGLGYRFYLDDWDMTSHTASAEVAITPAEHWLLSLAYRFYLQSAASHYEPFYEDMPLPDHYTSDKELTSVTSHRAELELMRAFVLDSLGSELRAVLLLAPTFYQYGDYLPLDAITAFDVSFSLEAKL